MSETARRAAAQSTASNEMAAVLENALVHDVSKGLKIMHVAAVPIAILHLGSVVAKDRVRFEGRCCLFSSTKHA